MVRRGGVEDNNAFLLLAWPLLCPSRDLFIVERACFAFRVACCASLPTLPIGLEAAGDKAGDKVKDGEARGGGG
jgi:hypothetical protein